VQILRVFVLLSKIPLGWVLTGLLVAPVFGQDLSFLEFGSFRQNWLEDVGFVPVEIVRSGNLERTSTVEYHTEDWTATAGLDYDETNGVLTFAPGETNKIIRVHYIFDADKEPGEAEELWVVLQNADPGSQIRVPGNRISLSIGDTSPEPRPVSGEVRENEGTFLVPIRRGGKPETLPEITLSYTTREGTAVPKLDYISTSGSVTMPAGAGEVTVPVTIVNDSRRENPDFFTFETRDSTGQTRSAEIGIIDDDPGFGFGIKSPVVVLESPGEVSIPVVRSGNGADTISVDYMTVDGTALEGEDYQKSAGTLTFSPDELEKNITVKLLGDSFVDEGESFQLILFNPSYGVNFGINTNLTVIIQDDDQGVSFEQVSLEQDLYIVGEDQRQVRLKVMKGSSPPSPTTISYEITGISAKEGEDYVGTGGTLTMGADETSKEIVIDLKDDAILEDPETFQVKLLSATRIGLGAKTLATIVLKDVEPVSAVDYEYTRGMEASEVDRLLVQKDGKILVASWFFAVDGVWCQELCRLNPDGSLDMGFAKGRGVQLSRNVNHSSPWGTLSLDTKNRIIVAGRFGWIEGKEIHGLTRLNPDGSVDETFNPVFDGFALMATPLPDTSVVFLTSRGLFKVFEDGTLDSNFEPPPLAWIARTALVADDTGRVLCANVRLNDGDTSHWPILRLLPNGALDPSFSIPEGSANIGDVILQPDGKIVVGTGPGACLATPTGPVCNTLFRLNADGTLDRSFSVTGQDGGFSPLALQSDGHIVAGYGVRNFYTEKSVKRFKSNGELDLGFGAAGWDGFVLSLAALHDGSLLAGGWFRSIDGSLTNIAHLVGHPVAGIAGMKIFPEGEIQIPVAASPGHDYVLEETIDFTKWNPVATEHAERGGVVFQVTSVGLPERKFYRVRVIE
jgi:uncharacterized delta-60 repeat protein